MDTQVQDAEQQRLGHPERQEDLPEQATAHIRLFSGDVLGATLADTSAAARKYPTPRIGRISSSAEFGQPPSFLRSLLTWTSTLRSKAFSGRPSATSAICSRVTTLPALRSSSSSTLNSTEVSSTGAFEQVTLRVAIDITISPTVSTSS